MQKFIHIRSDKFPILPNEDEEIVNPGTWGKALAQYLQEKLSERNEPVRFICCEDWGWWVELSSAPFAFGVCIYSNPEGPPTHFVCTDSIHGPTKWSWSKFQFIKTAPYQEKLLSDLESIFHEDPDIELIEITTDFPELPDI